VNSLKDYFEKVRNMNEITFFESRDIEMKAFIFDFDGTIADTLPVCFYAFQSVFKEFDQKDLTPEEIMNMFGPSETGIIRENLNHHNIDEAIELYYSKYEEKHEELVYNSEVVHEFLSLLLRDGYRLGIVTGKARKSLELSLKKLNLNDYFEVIITGDDVECPKPHPEGVLKAIRMLGVNKDDAVFVGDSDADIAAGKAAGIVTIGVHWLPTVQTATFTVKPDHFITSFESFKQLFNLVKV
jgi:pyrophosphatase PpaX